MKVTDKITITFEDRKNLMSRYDDCYFPWGLVDTEFGIGESSNNHESRNTPVVQKNGKTTKIKSAGFKKKQWDKEIPSLTYWSELYRITKDFACFGGNYFPEIVGNPFKPVKREEFKNFIIKNPTNWIIWDKMNGKNDFNDCEMIYVTKPIKSIILKHMWAGMMQGSSLDGTVMEGNKKKNEKRIHPTQKPVRIYEKLITILNIYSCIDTGLGSGGLAIACHNLGVDLVACERENDYYDSSIKRIKQHISQLAIFDAGA